MAKKGIKTSHILIAIVVLAALYAFYAGWIPLPTPAPAQIPGQPTPTGPSAGPGFISTLYFPVVEKLTGAQMKGSVNAEIWYSDNRPLVSEFHVDAYPDSVANMPNSMNGYVLVGNDNYVSTTDRGQEVYYHKESFGYSNEGVPSLGIIYIYNETTPTFTGYDDGTVEATTNITIGSGETITSTELKIKSGSDACVGNPDFSRPLAICFNGSTAAVANKFDEVRPVSYDSTIAVPSFLSGKAVIGDCYVLSTPALCDYAEYRFYVIMDAEASSNPAAGEAVYAILLDKTYYKDDMGIPAVGWEDSSTLATDSDIGIDGLATAKAVNCN